MPAQHRRTYGAVYEMALAGAFTMVPFIAYLLAGDPNAFRLLALPGGLAVTVVPVLVYLVIPESPRWHLRKGRPQIAVDIVNRIIERSGDPVSPLTVEELGDHREAVRDQLPPYWALFRRGQLRWTTVGILAGVCCRHRLFPDLRSSAKGAGRSRCGRLRGLRTEFAGVLREYPRQGLHRVPDGDHRTAVDHRLRARRIAPWPLPDADGALGGTDYATVVMVTGALITGFTVLSAFTATRVYLSEQFPTALRGRGHIFGESVRHGSSPACWRPF